ncbi:MAG: hypothetical protein ACREJV_12635 [Candidatus Rokuibacteriota bacterium]
METGTTAEVPRISVEEVRRQVAAGKALLVCACPDEAKGGVEAWKRATP